MSTRVVGRTRHHAPHEHPGIGAHHRGSAPSPRCRKLRTGARCRSRPSFGDAGVQSARSSQVNRNEARSNDGDYRIEVADFGPIVRASVDVRPLTVFAGPSNTGKSYLAMLVYALHRCFGPPVRSEFDLQRRTYWFSDAPVNALPDEDKLAARIAEWWSTGGKEQRRPLPHDLARAIRTAMEELTGAEEHLAAGSEPRLRRR